MSDIADIRLKVKEYTSKDPFEQVSEEFAIELVNNTHNRGGITYHSRNKLVDELNKHYHVINRTPPQQFITASPHTFKIHKILEKYQANQISKDEAIIELAEAHYAHLPT